MGSWSDDCTGPTVEKAPVGEKVGVSQRNLTKNVNNKTVQKVVVQAGKTTCRGHRARCFYNSNNNSKDIESSMVRPLNASINTFRALVHNNRSYASVVKNSKASDIVTSIQHVNDVQQAYTKVISTNNNNNITREVHRKPRETEYNSVDKQATVPNAASAKRLPYLGDGRNDLVNTEGDGVLLYDVNSNADDKFVYSLLFNGDRKIVNACNSVILQQFKAQSKYTFGFVPMSEPLMPSTLQLNSNGGYSVVDLHHKVKQHGKPNFIGARIPLSSQLNIENWKFLLRDYWDQQLIQFLQFGFPLGFNRDCKLQCEMGNHRSAIEFPSHVEAYIKEELEHGAIVGPFDNVPIHNCHISPFMTRPKANSDTRRVIIDLSWPKGYSVNDGVDKNAYMGTDFHLTFPTIDDLTAELTKLGKGAHLYKIDVSRAFRHLPIDPLDYDLLGLYWEGFYLDKNLPFGTRHGSQFFQRASDAVRYALRMRGFNVVNYIDDFLGFGVPSVAHKSYEALLQVLTDLGLTISKKKLVPPTTKAVCLGIEIDTVKGTLSIPKEKLAQIKAEVELWTHKNKCTRCQLQSLLGLLLYISKCVRPARCFLNRMLEVLREASDGNNIKLNDAFHRDLLWFRTFLQEYNGVSMYGHKKPDFTVELDACLTGMGGCVNNIVYHVPIPLGYNQFTIVHLEMVNILVALKLFGKTWRGNRVLIKCDNEAVVSVLRSGKARDPFLGACARNIWYLAALQDVEMQYVHVLGRNNRKADLLSRWSGTQQDITELGSLITNPIWLNTDLSLLQINEYI